MEEREEWEEGEEDNKDEEEEEEEEVEDVDNESEVASQSACNMVHPEKINPDVNTTKLQQEPKYDIVMEPDKKKEGKRR